MFHTTKKIALLSLPGMRFYSKDPSTIIISIILITTISLAMLSLAWIGITVDRERVYKNAENRLEIIRSLKQDDYLCSRLM
ncbi:MAG: hypothetical protein GF401_15585 [Chitinivibrionales bacterium]|nr:hypothetical protein [Chitinivibrionales bacterium]